MGVWGPREGTHPGVAGVAPSGVLKWLRAAWGLPGLCPWGTMLFSLIYLCLSRCGDNRDRGGNWVKAWVFREPPPGTTDQDYL